MRVSKNRLYSCVFTAAIFSFLSNIDVKASSLSSVPLSCHEGKLPYRCSDGAKHTMSDKTYQFVVPFSEKNGGNNSLISSAAIVAQQPNTVIEATRVEVKATESLEGTYGVIASQGGKVVLSDSTFNNVSTGLSADNGTIEVNRGSIKASQRGVYAEKQGTSVLLTNTKIELEGQGIGQGVALFSGVDAHIKMTGGLIDVTNAAALYVGARGSTILDGVTIISENQRMADRENTNEEDDVAHAVLNINPHGFTYLKNSDVLAADVDVLWVGLDPKAQTTVNQEGNILISRVNIEDSTITLTGNKHGMHFDKNTGNHEYEKRIVFLKKTTFEVPDGTVIHSNKSSGYIALTKDTKISGDLLLTAENGASVAILAASSSLTGGTRVADDSTVELYLTEGSKWVLTKRKNINQQALNGIMSSISFIKLSDSVIAFESPTFQEYQTLHIGKGGEEAYSAQGGARLYFNAYLNRDGSLNTQKTDRLLIHGDVSGKTTLYVQFVAENQKEEADDKNAHSISIVQVSGKAAEDSFQLSSAYIALEGLPYQYYLHAYGPGSSLGNSQAAQRLVKGDGDFWDFRLEGKYVQSASVASVVANSALRVRDVVPQVPTYLLLPNAFFHAGLMDISNQNKQLRTMRSISSRLLKNDETLALSINGYGGSYGYVSDLSALEYGYSGDFDYKAVETGILMKTIESAYSTTSFGLTGTYGKLSLQPRNVAKSQKSTFNKWSVTAYGSMEHDAGFYVDGFLSYGLFKGDVTSFAWGKTATLKANPLNISFSAGKAFMIGYEGFVFDPQVQLIYQQLQFHKARDIDGFDIEMGKSDQWVMRVGGRLTKKLTAFEEDHVTSFYGNFYFTHGFGEKKLVYFKDAFQLGSFGSSLETGFGIHSKLSSKVTFHGDLSYQHKFTKAGFSGIRFSAGLRYSF
ncbi:outer membrane autotransporter barrel domain-containing protein [Candidatus Bartonella washoeensis Sb944nv]|uniref:Outer membrane autotransporter barrel domain-containing protein n=1 Tax=Candidatus Bartonella washoeensis Sb944nv TaxID=1094563 RepID=J1JCH7_9HYPH|nr:outer membrane autotransporter barrel domain-containing protein [Bartonella washoeensis Sb944nv]